MKQQLKGFSIRHKAHDVSLPASFEQQNLRAKTSREQCCLWTRRVCSRNQVENIFTLGGIKHSVQYVFGESLWTETTNQVLSSVSISSLRANNRLKTLFSPNFAPREQFSLSSVSCALFHLLFVPISECAPNTKAMYFILMFTVLGVSVLGRECMCRVSSL